MHEVSSVPSPDDASSKVAAPQYGLLASITLPPKVRIQPKGLVLVVGPNSAGKTQMLKDLQAILTGQPRNLVVCSDFELKKPTDLEALISSLIENGSLRRDRDERGNEYIKQASPHLGGSPFRNHNIPVDRVSHDFGKMPIAPGGKQRVEAVPFLDLVGHSLTTALFLENRLTMANQCNQFDYDAQPPNNDLQALYLSKAAKAKLTDETQRVFGKGVWLDNSRGNTLCLRVNQSSFVPSADDRHEPEEMKKYRQIESEGDGLRSYVGICIALLLGRRPVCIIDEPELCLHPPQAYAMGQFIGRHGTSSEHATFASTHSSHVLRGVIETTENVQILRLTNVDGQFRAYMIGYAALKECIKRPLVRAETILDGIFADGVTIVESEGDRAVYLAALEGLRATLSLDSSTKERARRDILFIPVGGTGGIADIAKFYQTLRIPTAIIADLDLVMDADKLKRIVESLADQATLNAIVDVSQRVREQIKGVPPTVTEAEASTELARMASLNLSWKNDDDGTLKVQLNRLANRLDRMRALKNGGIETFKDYPAIYDGLIEIVNRCRGLGLFLVPVGELEYWAPSLMTEAPSRGKKAEWANHAAMKIRQSPSQAQDVLRFVGDILAFHSLQSA